MPEQKTGHGKKKFGKGEEECGQQNLYKPQLVQHKSLVVRSPMEKKTRHLKKKGENKSSDSYRQANRALEDEAVSHKKRKYTKPAKKLLAK